MKRFLAVGAVLAAMASAVFVARADAILFGTPDGNDHKGVGYIVFYDAKFTPLWRCTGSLVSTRVVLTAGHCAGRFDDSNGQFHTPALAQVWFDKDIARSKDYPTGPPVPCTGYTGFPCSGGASFGTPVPHPRYRGSVKKGVFNDIGVVKLDVAQSSKDVLPLAPLGTLDRTQPGASLTIVGFGTQSVTPPPADFRQRMRGTVTFLRTELDLSQPDDDVNYADFTNGDPAGAAACFGDSGGPVINGNGQIVAEMSVVDAYVDNYCIGKGFHFRTDTANSQQFLASVGVMIGGSAGAQADELVAKHGSNSLLAY